MGSFYMAGSYTKEVILPDSECFWMIGSKYIDRGRKIIIPLSLHIFCSYYDYGQVYEVIPSKITEDVLKWFECDGVNLHDFSEKFYLGFVHRTCAKIDKEAEENLNEYAIKEQQSDEYRWAKRMNEKLRDLVRDKLDLYTDEEIDGTGVTAFGYYGNDY